VETSALEKGAPLAPPVVAVVVVHEPGPWFEETLASLAGQDYPNLNVVFLLAGRPIDASGEDLEELILARIPHAFVRPLGANPGFGAAANEVMRLVEGDSGFFCICHDDVALDPDAIRMLVEELYRSNAGLVGPKLVAWDDPGLLQHVGLGLDRFGEVDPIVEPGEHDQEQHDAISDVFALPSACLLVRADLFRTLGGFDPAVAFHGDDIDLCWRAHLSGARVVVAPAARVRHREQLATRRPDLNHELLRARHRMRSVATLTGASRLPLRSLEVVLLIAAELVVGLFTGRVGEAWASLRGLAGLLPRTPSLLARRRAVARLRQVPEAEVQDLQVRGSARLTSYLRARDTETYVAAGTQVRRWRERSIGPALAWFAVLAAVVLASRTFFDRGVPSVGELLPFPESPRRLLDEFASGWSPAGLGDTVPNPTGWALLSLASVAWLFRMGLGLTLTVVGLVVLGIVGAWRLAGVYPSNRARVTVLVVYAAVPLVPGVVSTGRFPALVAYAAVPWFVHLVRSAAGIGTADPAAADVDLVDGVLELTPRERVRRTAVVGLVVAIAFAFSPAVLPVLALVAAVLAVTTLLAFAGWRTAMWLLVAGLAGCALGWLLNLPWSATLGWNDFVPASTAGAIGRGLVDVASMAIGRGELEVLALALYLPLLVAIAVSRAWRLTWAIRAAGLVLAFGALAVLQDRDALPVRVPEAGVLLAPVALGLAVACGSVVAAFSFDVRGRDFGWRQPLALLAGAAIAVGVFPGALSVTDGAWFTPRAGLATLLDAQLPDESADGVQRVLYVGDPRVLPLPGHDLGDGVAIAVSDQRPLEFAERWPASRPAADDQLAAALDQISSGATLRGGQLLAPYGIRYVVVPRIDGAASTATDPLPVPAGLTDALANQLDLVLAFNPPNFLVYENRVALPTPAMLTGETAAASRADDPATLVMADLSSATLTFGGVDGLDAAGDDLVRGTVHHAVPFDDRWVLTVNGREVAARTAFGFTTAYDVDAGAGELAYRSPASRALWLIAQAALWVAVLVAASRIRLPARFRPVRVEDETLIDLDATGPATIDTSAAVGPFDEPPAEWYGDTGARSLADLARAEGEITWVDDLLEDDDPPPGADPPSAGAPVEGERR
jgi:GT2 family glycosyltransferase